MLSQEDIDLLRPKRQLKPTSMTIAEARKQWLKDTRTMMKFSNGPVRSFEDWCELGELFNCTIEG